MTYRTMELKPHEYQKYYGQKGGLKFTWTGKTRLGPKLPSLGSLLNKGIRAGNQSMKNPKTKNLFSALKGLSEARKQLSGKGNSCKCQSGKGKKRQTKPRTPFQLDPKRRRGRQSN